MLKLNSVLHLETRVFWISELWHKATIEFFDECILILWLRTFLEVQALGKARGGGVGQGFGGEGH